ncbi:hypothetical protein GCM10012275_18610 [Longimycelium tulufanense]|uniref:PLL-like beta propeller domain-containing protein n=1 Tax=Longimycelium tulufanense TaxID=907463 RepID=A0A8J3CB85_9PSEU|nr:PIG-L family deacetylase [Longimycelium tulufanense]GGM47841.1 hypothetical protein GCM10012275_18610 [Longimycelium tulufanense]
MSRSMSHPYRVLVALALAGFMLACAPAEPAPVPRPAEPDRTRYLQVVAHQDDDILFMNPDVQDAIRGGYPVVTVFLTAGESNARDVGRYAAGRQAGARAAYAAMAGVADDWSGEPLRLGDQHQAELYTLRGKPRVQLVFLNLPDDNNPNATGGKHALLRLWKDRSKSLRVGTVVPQGATVPGSSSYSRRELVDALVTLLRRFQPTVVRTQDPQPDSRYTRNWRPFNDHPDHVVTARLMDEALRTYRVSGADARFVVRNYRNYNVEVVPPNLSPEQQKEKLDVFRAYAKNDPWVSTKGAYDVWPRRMRYRWPLGSSWVGHNADGRLQAFAVVSGQAVTWWQEGDGWSGPVSLADPGGPLAPGLSVVTDRQGRLRLFGRRLDTHEVVGLSQLKPNGRWNSVWEPLGAPGAHGPVVPESVAASQVGQPVVTVDGAGRLVLVIRNARGGVSARVCTSGSWGEWLNLGGSEVRAGVTAATRADGTVEVFATAPGGVLRWTQSGRSFAPGEPIRGVQPGGPPVAVRFGDRLAVLVTAAGGQQLFVGRQDRDGRWSTKMVPVPGGPGSVAGAAAGSDLLLVGRGADGRGRTLRMGSSGPPGPWTDLGGSLVDEPVAITARDGRVVLLTLGPASRLLVNVQYAPTPESQFTGWRTAGS